MLKRHRAHSLVLNSWLLLAQVRKAEKVCCYLLRCFLLWSRKCCVKINTGLFRTKYRVRNYFLVNIHINSLERLLDLQNGTGFYLQYITVPFNSLGDGVMRFCLLLCFGGCVFFCFIQCTDLGTYELLPGELCTVADILLAAVTTLHSSSYVVFRLINILFLQRD